MTEPLIDVAKLTAETQAKCDDASHDHNYAGFSHPEGGPAGTLACDISEDQERRVKMLAFSVEQTVLVHRANGGIGRGMVWFTRSGNNLSVHWKFVTSPTEAFEHAGMLDRIYAP